MTRDNFDELVMSAYCQEREDYPLAVIKTVERIRRADSDDERDEIIEKGFDFANKVLTWDEMSDAVNKYAGSSIVPTKIKGCFLSGKYSMSNRAVAAYQDGAMPMSKWTKEELVDGIIDKNFEHGIDADLEQKLRKHTTKWLKKNFLAYDSWHHTSKYYNRTEFYSILDMGEEEATELILKEEVRIPREKEKKALSMPARATWTEFYRHGSRWKTEDITCFGKVKDGWFFGVDNSKKRLDGKHFFYQSVELLEVKRAYRQVRGNLKGFKAWMEK